MEGPVPIQAPGKPKWLLGEDKPLELQRLETPKAQPQAAYVGLNYAHYPHAGYRPKKAGGKNTKSGTD
jgi:hypothetical protein